MNKISYDAYVLNQKINGNEVPSLEELIIASMEKGQDIKREEIIEKVSRIIGDSYDVEIASGISTILKKLEKQGVVEHSKQGYWEKI